MKSRCLPEESKAKSSPRSPSSPSCCYPDCFLCAIKFSPPDIHARQASFFSELFKELPCSSSSAAATSKQQLSIIRGLWSTAMAHPDDPLFVQLGILESMIQLVYKGLRDPVWLSTGDNVFVPYYATHILGSYTMNVERHAVHAVRYRAVAALAELAGGALTWVEQRVAVRCLSHLASYDATFPAVSASGVLRVAMELARGAPGLVYEQFAGLTVDRRLGFQRELLRGSGGDGGEEEEEEEERKAEEWASQLQCWSLQVVNCFALREEFLLSICRPEFLVDLPAMWGGLVNGNSPAGVGLLRTICYHKLGRIAIASCCSIVEALCNVARSSDDWQYMAVDCLLWLLQDPNTRSKVFSKAVIALADLVELATLGDQTKPGDLIMDILLSQQHHDELIQADDAAIAALEDAARLRKRIKIEKHLSREDIKITQAAALVLRLEGNARFSAGDVGGAAAKYSEALEVCPIKTKKDRVVIFNNRAQCYLLMGEADRAVSDTTRALCLSLGSRKKHGLTSSLWRRAQAYDMLGLAKESLLDALVFGCSASSSSCSASSTVEDDGWDDSGSRSSGGGGANFYVAKLVKKQMRRTWLFRDAARRMAEAEQLRRRECEEDEDQEEEDERDEEEQSDGDDGDGSGDDSEWETASESEIMKSRLLA